MMPIVASDKSEGSYTPVSEGVHIAACIAVIDLGNQHSAMFDKTQHKIMLTWELTDETIEIDGEEKPRVISKEYTLSLNEKSVLRNHLEAWRGKKFTEQELNGFDLINILGKFCQIQITHTEKNGKKYPNVQSIMAIPKGMALPSIVSETTYFALDDPGCLVLLEKIPKWIQDKITNSTTYQELVNTQVDPKSGDYQELDSEDLPF